METTTRNFITIETTVNVPVSKVWEVFNQPEHITQWCAASDDWHAPAATNDLREGGRFSTTMAARDGSFSFDFSGVYDIVKLNEHIAYTLDDGRKVEIIFTSEGDKTKIVETFEAESENPPEMQRQGWQAILDNFRKYAVKV